MPGQTPYTEAERVARNALVSAAARANVTEQDEVLGLVVLDDTGRAAHLAAHRALARPMPLPVFLDSIGITQAAELARRMEGVRDAVLAIPKDTGRTFVIESLAHFGAIIGPPVPPGPTFRSRLLRVAILAAYARPVRR